MTLPSVREELLGELDRLSPSAYRHGSPRVLPLFASWLLWSAALVVPLWTSACNDVRPESEPPSFALAAEPAVVIGDGDEEADLLFGVTGAVRLPSGTIVVADCGSTQLRFFDSEGRHLRTVGGRGEGPGEFRGRMHNLFPAGGDTVAVVDAPLLASSVHFFDGEGDFVRSLRLFSGAKALGRLRDGRLVAMRSDFHFSLLRERVPGIDTVTVTLFTLSPSGAVLDSVPGLFGREVELDRSGGISAFLRYTRTGFFAVLPDGIVYGNQIAPEYHVFDPALRLVGRVEAGTPGQPVTEEDRQRWASQKELLVPLGSRRFAVYSEAAAPVHPAYGEIAAGRDGAVWVQDPDRVGAYPLVWTRYSEGRPAARVQLPPRFFPFDFGADWVLGVRFDEQDLETVELYEIVPGQFSPLELPHKFAGVPHVPCDARTSRYW